MDTTDSDQPGAADRRVLTTSRDGKETKVVVVQQTYDTGIADVWDALTDAERLPRWFLAVSGDLRPGGRYQLEGNAGGEILVCEEPRRLAVTWEYDGSMSWVEVRLTAGQDADLGGTVLTLEHTMAVDDHWREFGPAATGIGWDSGLHGLALHLESGTAVDPEEAAAWMASEAGVAFLTSSGEAWCRADIASGSDAATAQAAATRTIAFYTATPE